MNAVSQDRAQTSQRIKVGMTGLAVVVLLILLAGAIFNSASHEKPAAVVGGPKAEIVANLAVGNGVDPVNEPLAELGVAPSAGDGTNPANGTTQAVAPPPARTPAAAPR